MPCRDDYADRDTEKNSVKLANKRVDELCQNLCYLCGQAEYEGFFDLLAKKNCRLREWWEKHKKSDEKRVIKEMQEHECSDPGELSDIFFSKAIGVHPVSDFHKRWFTELATRVCEWKRQMKKEESEERKLIMSAIQKLTPEERKALGLSGR